MLKELIKSKKLIWQLSKNDFKSKFAGSFFGILWAFVQPIVTVIVYWIVFDKALNVGTQGTKEGLQAPFVLWLSAGIVPWFYFSEVLSQGTGCLREYSYLVQKVVFQIRVLPVVKVVSSLFVHAFFVVFTIILCMFYGFKPSLYMLQVFYYSFALMVLVLGLIYATSAVVVFFKDLTQVIAILLQVWIWATPIMWNIDSPAISDKLDGVLGIIIRANPVYYISNGYRDALIGNVWFWERPGLTVYYWILTVVIFLLGTKVFKKLQPQFADVI